MHRSYLVPLTTSHLINCSLLAPNTNSGGSAVSMEVHPLNSEAIRVIKIGLIETPIQDIIASTHNQRYDHMGQRIDDISHNY